MEKKKISGEVVVGLLFFGAIVFLLIFGSRLTGYAVYEGAEDTNENNSSKNSIVIDFISLFCFM